MPTNLTQPHSAHVLITTDAIGGVWTYSLALAACFSDAGIKTSLAVLGPPPSALQLAAADRVFSCTVIPTSLPLDWQVASALDLSSIIFDLQKLLSHEAYTSVHLHSPALAAHTWPIPVVVVVHSCMATWWDEVERKPRPAEILLHARFCEAGLLTANSIIAPSRSFADAIGRAYSLTRDISVVYNAVAENERRDETRERFILFAGRLWDKAKNLPILEEAAELVDMPIQVAGPISSPGQPVVSCRNVVHVGDLPQGKLCDMMRRATAFVAPSVYEPFGLAVLEAAQLATPLILADIPTFRELWLDAALFVPADNAAAWGMAISTIAADPALAQRLGSAARARAEIYSLSCMGNATMSHHFSSCANTLAA